MYEPTNLAIPLTVLLPVNLSSRCSAVKDAQRALFSHRSTLASLWHAWSMDARGRGQCRATPRRLSARTFDVQPCCAKYFGIRHNVLSMGTTDRRTIYIYIYIYIYMVRAQLYRLCGARSGSPQLLTLPSSMCTIVQTIVTSVLNELKSSDSQDSQFQLK